MGANFYLFFLLNTLFCLILYIEAMNKRHKSKEEKVIISDGLYQSLQSKANILVAQSFNGYPERQLKEIAHDITVDFLFFSRSFAVTFDESRGELAPFFSSYVRKKCMGLWGRMFDKRFSLPAFSQDIRDTKTTTEEKFEIKESLLRFIRDITQKRRHRGIDLEKLFMAIVKSAIDEGRYSTTSICRMLKTTDRRGVKSGVQYLKRVLNDVYHLK